MIDNDYHNDDHDDNNHDNWKGGDLLGFLPSCPLLGLVSVQSRSLRTPEVDFHNCEAFYEVYTGVYYITITITIITTNYKQTGRQTTF